MPESAAELALWMTGRRTHASIHSTQFRLRTPQDYLQLGKKVTSARAAGEEKV